MATEEPITETETETPDNVVAFSVETFRAAYPKITAALVPDAQLEILWTVAEQFIDNTAGSMFPYSRKDCVKTRQVMLYLMLCHLATMATWDVNQSGPVASAGEGSVSVSFGLQTAYGQEWLSGTPCGRTLLQMLIPYALGGRISIVDNYHPYG